MTTTAPPPRVAGLDSIRFFCALTVIFFHDTAPPLFPFLSRDSPPGRVVLGLYDAAFNGQAAVIAFFVVSGFCIHFAYGPGRPFRALPFLLSRGARLLIPTGAYLLLLRAIPTPEPRMKLLLWSIWCELIYYALYPLLRLLFQKASVRPVLLGSYAVALPLTWHTLAQPEWTGMFVPGGLTWLLTLPCWLLGCLLAETVRLPAAPPITSRALWAWRGGAAALGFLAYLAMLQLRVSFLWSLQGFALYTYFWLRAEIGWHITHAPSRLLERLGSYTFSIYLLHMPAKLAWESLLPGRSALLWLGELLFILGASALFFYAVEQPSHRLARSLTRRRG